MSKSVLRFSLKGMFAFTFLLCAALAAIYYGGPRVTYIVVGVVVANSFGAVVALIVTFVLRFPRDGGYRNEFNQEDDEFETD